MLPEAQRSLWPKLGDTPKQFVLYGGTALALRLGHRQSVDFDFFSSEPFDTAALQRSVPYLHEARVLQEETNTLSAFVEAEKGRGRVQVSFFGGLDLGEVMRPEEAPENHLPVASTLDIFGMKCATITQRASVKDYVDIHAIMTEGGLPLEQGLGAAQAIYGAQFEPEHSLRALSYFGDLEGLTEAQKRDLLKAAEAVDLGRLPKKVAERQLGADRGREKGLER